MIRRRVPAGRDAAVLAERWRYNLGHLPKPQYALLQLVLREILIASKQMLTDEKLLMRRFEEERMSLERRAEPAESMEDTWQRRNLSSMR